MIRKKAFCFAAFTAAALSLGVLASGCGDGGSIDPNPLNGDNNRVIYNYNVLAQATANARTDINARIVGVQYSLEGELSRIYNFEHKEADSNIDIEICNVDRNVQTVTAAYFDAEGSLIAVGVDKLNWVDKVATVADPQIIMLGENPTFDFGASSYVLAPNGETRLSVKVVPVGYTGAAIDITDLAVFCEINKEVLAPVVDGFHGDFYGVGYGIIDNEDAYAVIPGRADRISLNESIYVTDQVPSVMNLVSADPEIYIEVDRYINLLYAPSDKVSFSLDKVPLHVDGAPEVYILPINKMALKVTASEYTNIEGKGPQPVIVGGTDITYDPKVNIDVVALEWGKENKAYITDNKFVELNGINDTQDSDRYKVTVTYGESEEVYDYLYIIASQASSNLAFACEGKFLSRIAATGTYNMSIAGRIMGAGVESDPLEFPSFIIADGTYPAVRELVGAEDYIEEYVQNEAGKNAYTVKVISVPNSGNGISLDLSETTDPAFIPTEVVE
ncbi:MAG: hypothetical protein ACI38Q_06020 [Candidatus Bruticola sp.]